MGPPPGIKIEINGGGGGLVVELKVNGYGGGVVPTSSVEIEKNGVEEDLLSNSR